MIFKLFLIFIITTSLNSSSEITLKWLSSKPKSIAKDFYIYRFLDQNISADEAVEALSQVNIFNTLIFKKFANKYNNEDLKDYVRCINLDTTKLLNEPGYCIEAGLSVYEATKLSKKDLDTVVSKTQTQFVDFSAVISLIASQNPFYGISLVKPKVFFTLFNNCGSHYRQTHFNHHFNKEFLNKIQSFDDFSLFVKLIITNTNMQKAQISLLNIPFEDLDFKTSFLLAINAIRHNKLKIAQKYLESANKKAYFQFDKDNSNFWLYQITNNDIYLEKLKQSWDLNLYTIFANKNDLSKLYENIVFKFENLQLENNNFNISDPFEWIDYLDKTKKLNEKQFQTYSDRFNYQNTQAHKAFITERYFKYKKSYFITPYYDLIKKYDLNTQALIYAIARQESRFIPSSISSAYAMGVMQIMPFLSKALAKQLGEKYDIDAQLEPYTNIRYAKKHLHYLQSALKHPLFIAYGYNGGIGFTKRTLKNKQLFKPSKYEPYLSMELLPYDETKKYGKKVLANYFIYQNYLNPSNPIPFNQLISSICTTNKY
ncbi:MAG: transglycosylase SLT domain-containing protein [Campylobacterales bacterium]|nr:transglycosylase SLT domain-containing protein [Campylobacterales bacterium]